MYAQSPVFYKEAKEKSENGIVPAASIRESRGFEAMIAKELRKQFADLVKKCQEHGVDPFGFGLYARAYQYSEWKSVQDNWGKAFAKADVQINPKVAIKIFGVTE